MGKDTYIPFFAIFVLIVASVSSLYVHAMQNTSESITIQNQNYTVDQLFNLGERRTLSELGVSGVALDDLILKTGVAYPEQNEYTIIGADGYQKTVIWENMKNGVLTEDREVVFSDLPKAFRVKDVVTIEVV